MRTHQSTVSSWYSSFHPGWQLIRRAAWLALGLALAVVSGPHPASALPDHTTYDIVLGQARKDLRRQNAPDGSGMYAPAAVAIDRKHTPNHLYVADLINARVLGWNDINQARSGAPADLVLGQPDLYATERYRSDNKAVSRPTGLAVGPDGTVWVSDENNGRVVGFYYPYDPNQSHDDNVTADVLIGQPMWGMGFPDSACNGAGYFYSPNPSTANTLCYPELLTTDSMGNLYIADVLNNRVLLYMATTLQKQKIGASADQVFGQDSMVNQPVYDPSCNKGHQATPDATTLCIPVGTYVQEEGGTYRLYIADTNNNRVLVYDNALTIPSPKKADRVIGHASMTLSFSGSLGLERLNQPATMTIDGNGVLWVSDNAANRVVGFNPPYDNTVTNPTGGVDIAASYLLGQPDFFTGLPNNGPPDRQPPPPTAFTMNNPGGMAVDAKGRLVVADTSNNRVLFYDNPTEQPRASLVLGQIDMVHNTVDITRASGLSFPAGVAVDRPGPVARSIPGEPMHVYVADFGNSRVLGWWDLGALKDGKPADLVIGQGSMNDYACNQNGTPGPGTLCWPRGLAVDRNGDVWVADTWNNRVLRFPRPFEGRGRTPVANLVLGQQSFQWSQPNGIGLAQPSTRSLWSPSGLALQASSDPNNFQPAMVWVADRENDRVLGYAPPYSNGMKASRILIRATIDKTRDPFGQIGCPPQQDTTALCAPSGLALDADNNLWVTDRDHHRVALYETTLPDPKLPLLRSEPLAIIGQAAFDQVGTPPLTERGVRWPEGVSVELSTGTDGKKQGVAIAVTDGYDNRVMLFDPVRAGPTLRGVWGSSRTDIWAVGDAGAMARVDTRGLWTTLSAKSGTTANLRGIWGSGAMDVWAVGDTGALIHFDGTAWTSMSAKSGTTANLHGIWGSGATNVWAVGDGGALIHFDGTAWTSMSAKSGTTANLRGIWGSGAMDVWAVGDAGAVVHFDGAAWTSVTAKSGTTANLRGIWGSGAMDVWAVGDTGALIHFDGAAWTSMSAKSGTTANLTGVWGSGPSDVWTTGDAGTLLHFDGTAWTPPPGQPATVRNRTAVWGNDSGDLWSMGEIGTGLHISVMGVAPLNAKISLFFVFQPVATGVIGQPNMTTRLQNGDSGFFNERPLGVSTGMAIPGAVLALPEGLFIAETGVPPGGHAAGPNGVRQGLTDLSPPLYRDSPNHRVVVIKSKSFPAPGPDQPTPPSDGSVNQPPPWSVDLGGSAEQPPDMQKASGSGGCHVGGGGAPQPPVGLLVLGLLVAGLVLRRRR